MLAIDLIVNNYSVHKTYDNVFSDITGCHIDACTFTNHNRIFH